VVSDKIVYLTKKSNSIFQLQTTIFLNGTHLVWIKNKLFNASHTSLVFEKHNSNETNISSFFQLNYTKMVIKTTLSAALIEVKSLLFHQSKLSLFILFLFSSKLDHITCPDLLLNNEARRYGGPVSAYWKIVCSLQYIQLPSSALFAKQFEECQDFSMR